jgi:hypothetical protein
MNKIKLLTLFVFMTHLCCAQDYNFYGSMTEEQLQLHLNRSISMNGFVNDRFEPSYQMDMPTYWLEVNMLANTNARFIGRACGLWGDEGWLNQGYFSAISTMVNDITAAYTNKGLVKPIIQGAILEEVSSQINNVYIPGYVLTEYGQPNSIAKKFTQSNIVRYDNGVATTKPDISKIETQMWFYYLATQYINAGIEALHLGDYQEMGKNDPNKINWSNWAGKVRQYASTRNRGLVLLDGHTWGEYVNNTDLLLHDFHSGPQRGMGVGTPMWNSGGQPIGGSARISDNSCSWYKHMYGGQTYFGWSTPVLPFLIELDNYGGIKLDNSNITLVNKTPPSCWNMWGFDEIQWFSAQSAAYRQAWLAYSRFKTKCLNPKGIFQMPGRRNIVTYNNAGYTTGYTQYRAIHAYWDDETVIKNIWDGLYDGADGWVPHNFTQEKVWKDPPAHVKSNVIFASPDKMYYIADDNTIHGYVKVSGQWLTVSPTNAAQIHPSNPKPIANQVLARNGLAASPDGSMLIYIGTDGYIHGFNINSVWQYEYFDFAGNASMQQQNLLAINNLIFPKNNRIYYTANESSGVRSMHAFIKQGGNWLTASPTYSAQSTYGQSLSSQARPRGTFCGLTYDFINDFIYYIGEDGYIHLFKAMNDWDYLYKGDAAKPQMIAQNLTVMSKNLAVSGDKIYYLAQESNGNRTVHAVINLGNGVSWSTVSPSYGCSLPLTSQLKAKSMGEIAVSPNGNTIVYCGELDQLSYFQDLGSSSYSYHGFYGGGRYQYNSLQMPNNSEIYYGGNYSNSTGASNQVHMFKKELTTCDNAWVQAIEFNPQQGQRPEYNDSVAIDSTALKYYEKIIKSQTAYVTIVETNGEYKSADSSSITSIGTGNRQINYIKIYPNPASKVVYIEPVFNNNTSFKVVLRSVIGNKVKQADLNNLVINSIDISDLTSGVYILTVYDANGKQIKNEKLQIQ